MRAERPRRARGALVVVLAGLVVGTGAADAEGGTGSISGRVVTDGPAACVLVLDSSGQSVASAASGAGGGYVVGDVPAGSWRVEFLPDGGCIGADSDQAFQYYANAGTPASATPVIVSAGHTTSGVDATLAAASTIEGTVTSRSGQPISGVCALLEDTAGRPVLRQPSDRNGNYALGQLPSGRFVVQFVDDGCVGRANRYASSYDSGASTLATARVLVLGAGQELTGIDAALAPLASPPPPGKTTTRPVTPSAPKPKPKPKSKGKRVARVSLLVPSGHRWVVDSHHRLRLRLSCAAHGLTCRTTATVRRPRRVHHHAVGGPLAGSRALTVRAGHRATVLVRLRGATSGRLWVTLRLRGHKASRPELISVRWPRTARKHKARKKR